MNKYSSQIKNQSSQTPQHQPPQIKKEMTEEDKSTAEQWKNKGNEFFKEGKYQDSIECYSKAIQINPTAIYYSNR